MEERKQYMAKRQTKLTDISEMGKKTNMKKKQPAKKQLIDMTETQLGPIKWKNFRNMKSPTHFPQI